MGVNPSRKRVRRDIRTCYQCRQRKVKCQLTTDESLDSCSQCLKQGLQCSPHGTDKDSNHELDPPDPRDGQSTGQSLEVALVRVESLLKQLVETQTQTSSPSTVQPPTHNSEPDIADLSLFAPSAEFAECASTTSFANFETHNSSKTTTQQLRSPEQNVKESLIGLVPSPKDAATIVNSSTAWLWGPELPQGSVLAANDIFRLLDTAGLAEGTAIHVAKQLLLFALYMQQLPATFDIRFLEHPDIERTIESITERVKVFLALHEDDPSSVDTLECLLLLGSICLNDAQIRKAWMSFRRALDLARLKGLSRSYSQAQRNLIVPEAALRRRIWLSLISADAYCSLLLGLHPSGEAFPFGPDHEAWKDPSTEDASNVQRQISMIVTKIAKRNAEMIQYNQTPTSIADLEEIETALDQIQTSTSPDWWKPPLFREASNLHTGSDASRLVCHLWWFQARIFARLPNAFEPESHEAEKSLKICMEASRITLQRSIGLQHARDYLSRCRAADQAAFLAAVILLLARTQAALTCQASAPSRHDSDGALIEQMIGIFEAVGQGSPREQVAKRFGEILVELFDAVLTKQGASSTNTTNYKKSLETKLDDTILDAIYPFIDTQSPAFKVLRKYSGWHQDVVFNEESAGS